MDQDTEANIPLKTSPYDDTENQAPPRTTPTLKGRLITWLRNHEEILFKLVMTLAVCLLLIYFMLVIGVSVDAVSNKTVVLLLQKYVNFTVMFCGGVWVITASLLILFGLACVFACIWSKHGISDCESPLKPLMDVFPYVLSVGLASSFLTMIQVVTQIMVGVPAGTN